jgi:hypothetical protein
MLLLVAAFDFSGLANRSRHILFWTDQTPFVSLGKAIRLHVVNAATDIVIKEWLAYILITNRGRGVAPGHLLSF